MFNGYEVLLEIYQDYYWHIWKDVFKNLKEYILYTAKNTTLSRKSQVNIKLDKNLLNIAKKLAMEANLLKDKNISFENKVEDLRIKDDNNINLSIANLYLYAITIAHKYWKI